MLRYSYTYEKTEARQNAEALATLAAFAVVVALVPETAPLIVGGAAMMPY